MKKITVMLVAAAVAGGAYADIFANMQVGYGIGGNGSGGGIVDNVAGAQVIVQLIDGLGDGLNYAAPGGISGLAMDGNDLLLSTWTSTATGGGDFFDWAAGAASVVNVPYAVDTYVRVIGAGVDGVSAGDWVWESGLIPFTNIDMGAVPPPSPQDIFYDNGGVGAVADGSVQVIPEPATIGLMGIAGLGMYLARRKVRR